MVYNLKVSKDHFFILVPVFLYQSYRTNDSPEFGGISPLTLKLTTEEEIINYTISPADVCVMVLVWHAVIIICHEYYLSTINDHEYY